MSSQDDIACKKCDEIYTEINYKWCKPCQINGLNQNFASWTSGNETIDKLIQEMQLKIKNYDDMVVEWISFDQFNDIKKIYEDNFNVLYSAIWIDGPFKCDGSDKIRRKRMPNKKVVLEYLNNSQNNNITKGFLNEVKSYSIENDDHSDIITIYGISQNPDTKDYVIVLQDCYCVNCGKIYTDKRYKWCNPCLLNELKQNFENWTSGNEIFDELIQENQLEVKSLNDSIFEWIPYNQLDTIKEIDMTLYSAIWINGPLRYNYDKMEWEKIPNEKINLIYFDSSLKLTKKDDVPYDKIYGISQNPDTNNYILIFQDCYCKNCVEWIPYNQFNDIKKIGKDDSANILYSATWMDGLLEYDCNKMEYKRIPNKEVVLKYLGNNIINEFLNEIKSYFAEHTIFVNGPFCYYYGKMEWEREPNEKVTLIRLNNSQITIDQFLNKIEKYIDERHRMDTTIELNKTFRELFYAEDYIAVDENINIVKVYGITQNPDSKDYIIVLQDWCCENCNEMYESKEYKWCNSCQIDNLKQSFANWTSENEQIDEIVQNLQLDIEKHNDIIVEWIPYNHFNNIKEIVNVKGDCATLYSANWMNGLLHYEYYKWKRRSNTKVNLKCLHNSQDITDEILNEKIESYYIRNNEGKVDEEDYYCYRLPKIYGISQNPNTKDYIIVLEDGNHCETCGEIYEAIDFKWCESCQVNKLIKNFTNWTSGNEIIDKYIQGMQLELQSHFCAIIVEWIPYNRLNDIEKMGNDSSILHSATWIDGPLKYDVIEWKRISNKKVTLKYLYDSYNITNESLNEEVEPFTDEIGYYYNSIIYGMSQNPDTKDYILVLQDEIVCEKCFQIYKYVNSKKCNPCKINNLKQNFANWTSGNKQIDELIQKMQLESKDYDTVIEWIPYNQLSNIKRTGKIDSNIYSATWIKRNYEVTLKYLSNLQNKNTDEFLNEIKSHFIEYKSIIKIFGLSQDPSTKDYIVVLKNGSHCKICGGLYINSWCKSCQMSVLKNNFEYWTSKNKIIDELIQEMQLNIQNYNDIIVEWIPYDQLNDIKEIVALKNLCNSQNINEFLNEVKSYFFKVDDPSHDINFTPKIYGISQNLDTKDYIIVLEDCYCENCVEWIPYDQFDDIKKIGKGGFSTVYSASWTNGPLQYREDHKKLERKCNEEVALKCLHNSQNITNGFLHEVKNYSISDDGILKIYGISQNPRTKDYIIVLQLASGNFVECKYIKKPWYWTEKLHILNDIIDCLKIIHDNEMVHRDLHTGNILTLPILTYGPFIEKTCISDMGLCREVNLDNMDEIKVYGVMPYVAPEVLRGKTYTQAADIYSFGMIMYFVATRRQPFANCAHDETLALNICNGIRPEINELEAPKSYIELMKKCWNSNPDDRPKAIEIKEEINKQIQDAEKNKIRFSYIGNNKPTHPQAIYTSRLLNPFTENLRKYDNINNNSVEVIDFTKVI
ncbi:kinase-like domain-containing protein [Rhizophagus clarus]|uniref:Kinase-like domain-containing protein n=1 Tax=Rhizophagus clarus TaxID=94130 RepID=A0A8H3QII7_9GLOM|nr:kinase-like domain-containing protein [Rhizophagus clarus]